MKLKHILVLALATLTLRVLPLPTLSPGGHLEPLLHAQAVGDMNWVNIHSAYVRADFTDANASGLQNIPDLTFSVPATRAATYFLDCDLHYSQATVVADNFGVKFTGNNPTNAQIGGVMATNATAYASGTPATITNQTAANVVTGTPAVTTVLYAHLGGAFEVAANAVDTVVNIMVAQSTAANVVVVKRDSVCKWGAIP